MIRIDFSVRRVYIAAFAAIGYVLAHRSVNSYDWSTSRALAAIASDAAILAVLFFGFWKIDRWLQPKSLAARGHKALHFCFTLTAVALAAGAQVLYQKTGEMLDLGIVSFFLGHFGELTGATESVIDQNVVLMVIACFGFYLLSLIRMRGRLLKTLQYALFLSPLCLIAFDFVYKLTDETVVPAQLVAERALYKGRYANLAETQQKWLAAEQRSWRDGILSGISASAAYSISQYRSLEGRTDPVTAYTPPKQLSPPRIRPNLLFIILESTRADVLGTHSGDGKNGAYTPYLDQLADNSWVYERAYTTIPHTSKALVGIYCGTFAKFGTNSFESTAGHYPLNCLPKLLKPLGYGSGHFQTAPGAFEQRSQFLINSGFEHAIVQEDLNPRAQEKYGYLGLDDRLLVAPMLAWMQQQHRDGRPFFASMLTVMTHHPYVSPGNTEPLRDPAQGKQSYLRAIGYTDNILRELLEGMRQRGLLDNTIVTITGDHGEAFAEHGQVAHNGSAYEEGMHVPLIVHAPDFLPGARRIAGLRQHIDIVPSLLELLGTHHDGLLPGKSLFSNDVGHEEIITSCFYENYCLDHYQSDGSKLVYFYGRRPSDLFDLRADPVEQNNLAPRTEPDQLEARLHRAAKLRKSFDQAYPK